MTETQYLSIQPGAKLRILSEEGEWVAAKAASPTRVELTDTQYEYPTTARRAFVNLAEAVRTMDEDPKNVCTMLTALAGLHVTEVTRSSLLIAYAENSADDREVLARLFSLILDGQEKFDTARFIHHATSDSVADDDSESGKWSFNRTHQAEAQKTTIESVPEDGEGETVIV